MDSPGSVGGTPAQPAPVAVSSALPPVPSYLVEKIMQGQFIDLTLLRPCNLRHLPVIEPAPIQLGRLVRSELQPIRNFQVWSEAWAVHGAVIANKCPENAADQFSYFLLLASAQRDITGMGWLDYDVAPVSRLLTRTLSLGGGNAYLVDEHHIIQRRPTPQGYLLKAPAPLFKVECQFLHLQSVQIPALLPTL